MEDTHVVIDRVNMEFPSVKQNCSFYAIFDGHGGIEVSEACQKLLAATFFADASFGKRKVLFVQLKLQRNMALPLPKPF